MLESAKPGAGAILETPPAAITLHFDSILEPVFCRITVKNTTDNHVVTGPVQSGGRDGTSLRMVLPALPAGHYRVIWLAVSPDGHRTSGDYTFAIK